MMSSFKLATIFFLQTSGCGFTRDSQDSVVCPSGNLHPENRSQTKHN